MSLHTPHHHYYNFLHSKTMVKLRNEKPRGERNESQFKGARKRKWGKWVSEVRLPNSRERIWLGSYDTAEKAARAFDAAVFCLRGPSAKFNFPHNPPDIAFGKSLTPSEIQAFAARFANSEPPATIHSEQSTSSCGTESPSPSVRLEWETPVVGSFTDGLTMDSGNYGLDYGIFPGFDDFSSDVVIGSSVGNIGGEEEEDKVDGILVSESFLWDF
ncbi:ethylene-responsive transcription factor ERF017 [Gossypium raimondii]|uniref:AP2/ERF domain-containing protein n=2 Tax=Gossypium raimondii TaxID=29730 RepID=A0A0D2U5G8_GOSRA|nr:ethylene-responsive transcription factor ERF017 [Gossypium raimondii]KJB82973.1 hypothetical protein B456_013G222700 [Gossypium raimondii]